MNRDEKQAIRNHMTMYRQEILDHTWTRCVNCGSDQHIELHHIVPLANGGNHIFTNIVPLCYDCHLKAHNKIKRQSGYRETRNTRKSQPEKIKKKKVVKVEKKKPRYLIKKNEKGEVVVKTIN